MCAFVSRRFFHRLAQWREKLSKRPDEASGLRFFGPAQHGVVRFMTFGLYGVLGIKAPCKRSQNKRRLYGESPAGRFASPRLPRQTPSKPRPNRNKSKHGAGSGRRDANQTNRNREKQPSANMGAAAQRPRLPRKRPMPDVALPNSHRGRGNPDFSFGSPRQRRTICRQTSPSGDDDTTIDPAPKRRFGMARRRCARGMAGHLRPGLPVDSLPAPAVSAQTNLDSRSFGPSPARPPGPDHKGSDPTTAERACPSLKILLRLLCGRINPSTWIPLGSSRRRAQTPRSAAQRPHHRIDPASPQSKRGAAPIARQRFARPSQGNMIRIKKTQTRDKRSLAATIGNSLQRQTEPAFGGARSKKSRAVPLANHTATPSLDLEMSKRCGAKPRVL